MGPDSGRHSLGGYRDGPSSVHTSRTMMLAELQALLDAVPATAGPAEHRAAILDHNLLSKPTRATRHRTAQRLEELYVLDPANEPFHVFRMLWDHGPHGRPLLAFLLAAWRDPLLRQSTPFLLKMLPGQSLSPANTSEYLEHSYPHRFGDKTRLSVAQNLASSWTQAGYLVGKIKKQRVRADATPITTAYALYLAFCRGARGSLLLDSPWARLLDRTGHEVVELAIEASRQGWLLYKSSGSVTEITFPHWKVAAREAG